MEELAIKLLLAPALVASATLAGWRFGPAIGGWLSALPVIAGPVLLVLALDHDASFSARAATGTLLGLVALSAFIVVYARLAPRAGWALTLLAGWSAFFAATAALTGLDVAPALAGAMAAGSFAAAAWLTRPATSGAPTARGSRGDLLGRVLVTATLVVVLAEVADALGPELGGLLVAFPVLASVLSAFTHRRDGGAAASGLLRGMIAGLVSFAGFCLAVALWLPALGIALGFALASALAVALHALTLPLARV